ncbi:MAG: glucose PTS transporter subunit IIA [Malacoplasma sp.]|nr:glucose PTS transporter subunit IIA [Malacoplasma sp.]MDE5774880.1 glucose PTS transporter subunit IIA [Malacoplasma sp.]MDE7099807.1 glucose PTS transporter subunit IIA [Malacoplasma sp.]
MNTYIKQDFALDSQVKQELQKTRFRTVFHKDKVKKEKQKGKTKEFIAKLSKGLMLPIAMLPIAGIFLGVGSAIIANANGNEGLTIFGNFLSVPGNAVFGALPLLFAIAIAIAFTGDAGPAALACFIGFLVFSALQAALATPVTYMDQYGTTQTVGYNLLFYGPGSMGSISPTADNFKMTGFDAAANVATYSQDGTVAAGLPSSLFGQVIGINQLQSSVFGGFLVGFLVAFLYNRYKNIKLHPIIGFFNGVRFVPIVTFVAMFPVTILFLMLWPLIGILLALIGQGLGSAVGVNSFIFGYIERALVPFGLHHAFYSPLWYTSAGGSIDLTKSAIIWFDGKAYAVLPSQTTNGVQTWNQLVQSLTGASTGTADNPGTVAGDQTMWAFINRNLLGRSVWLSEINVSNYDAVSGIYEIPSLTITNEPISHQLTWTDLTSGQAAIENAKGANGFQGVNVGQYLQGKYVFMIMGLPFAAFAMVMAAPKENRKLAMSICMSAGFTSFLTGITEPIEYTFLFLAPWLFWGVHAFFCALAFGLMNWIGLITMAAGAPGLAPHIGMSFSGGLIDWIVYGAIQIQFGSNAWWSFIFGLAYAPIYYFLFYYLIKRFNIQTPGRGENVRLFTKEDYKNKQAGAQQSSNSNLNNDLVLALKVVKAYGGFENIKNVDACITKLRIQVNNQSIVDTKKLMELGARGTIKPSPQSVYAVFGPEADIIKGNIKTLMSNLESNPSLKNDYNKVMDGDSSTSKSIPEPKSSPLVSEPVKKESEKSKVSPTENKPDTDLSEEKIVINSPFTGQIVSLTRVPDDTFSQNMMGVGIAIVPSTGRMYSPISGKVSLVFDTKHAYTFQSEKGTQVMVHIGIDSINLKDKKGKTLHPFESRVKTGDPVNAGEWVATVNLGDLKFAKSNKTPIIVLNETLQGREIKILKKSGEVQKGTPLFEILPKKN